MNKMGIAFGMGIVLAVLVMFTVSAVPAVNAATVYFKPQHSSANTSEYDYVTVYVNITADETLGQTDLQIQFDPARVDITGCFKPCPPAPTGPDQYCWGALDCNFDYTDNGYMWGGVGDAQVSYNHPVYGWMWKTADLGYMEGPMTELGLCVYEVKAVGTPGESPFNFGFEYTPSGCEICQPCNLFNGSGKALDNVTWINGTFTHEGEKPLETFEKDLVTGWNLISLPLTPEDNSANAVLSSMSGKYGAVYRYDATSKQFEDVTSGTMDPGIGYFVNVTTDGIWTYEGMAYTLMDISLKRGLNMVGWLNCTKQISGNLSSIDGKYNYNAQWNTTSTSYEVYGPHAPEVFNDFFDMKRGEGYWIAAKEDCTLTESCSG